MRRVALLWILAGCGRLGFDRATGDAAGGMQTDAPITDAMGDVAASAIQIVQTSPVVVGTGNGTVTLGTPSTPGTLLVLTLAANDASSLLLPVGWMMATLSTTNGACADVIAYYPANPGGITSVSFTILAGQPNVAQVTEIEGAAASPLDQYLSASGTSPVTIQTVQTNASVAVAGEAAVTVFCEDTTSPTYTHDTSWMNLGSHSDVSSLPSYLAGFRVVGAPAIVSQTVMSNFAAKYAAVIATFKPQ